MAALHILRAIFPDDLKMLKDSLNPDSIMEGRKIKQSLIKHYPEIVVKT